MIHFKIKEKAQMVLEALAGEFKLFKELTSTPEANLWRLIAYYCKMDRTFEVKNLTYQGERLNEDCCWVTFDGYCGIYRNSIRSKNPKSPNKVYLKDAPCGTMIGQDIHVFPDIKNQYISETSEKTKLLRFDKEGFNMYLKGFLDAKYQKIITFINTVGTLKRTRSNFSAFMNLVMMFNSRKVAGNTTLVR